jgi:hypothetical protein
MIVQGLGTDDTTLGCEQTANSNRLQGTRSVAHQVETRASRAPIVSALDDFSQNPPLTQSDRQRKARKPAADDHYALYHRRVPSSQVPGLAAKRHVL